MNHIKKVAMIIFMENDLEKAINFYEKLGMTTSFHVPGKWAEMRIGEVQIGLCPVEQELTDYRTGIIFEVEDARAFYEQYKDEFTFVSEPVEAIHGIMLSLKDPSGNIFDLYQPTPEKVKEYAQKMHTEGKHSGGCGC